MGARCLLEWYRPYLVNGVYCPHNFARVLFPIRVLWWVLWSNRSQRTSQGRQDGERMLAGSIQGKDPFLGEAWEGEGTHQR